jgi:hypothetical protein
MRRLLTDLGDELPHLRENLAHMDGCSLAVSQQNRLIDLALSGSNMVERLLSRTAFSVLEEKARLEALADSFVEFHDSLSTECLKDPLVKSKLFAGQCRQIASCIESVKAFATVERVVFGT